MQVTYFYHYADGSDFTVNGNSATGMIYDASDPDGTAFQNGLLQKSLNADADPIDHAKAIFGTIGEVDGGIVIAKGWRMMNGLSKSAALKVLGDVTGAAGIANSFRKAYVNRNNKLLATLYGLEGAGQAIILFCGGEEFELIYNLGGMAVDIGIDYYSNSLKHGAE
jgi:hypothetical protein